MEIVYENPWFKVEKHGKMHFVSENKQKNAAAVLLLVDGTHFALVEVFRVALGKMCIEIPRGYGNDGEDSFSAALRECNEETGFIIDFENIRKIGSMSPNSGILASTIDVFLANASSTTRLTKFDSDKEINKVILVEKEKIGDFIKENNVSDSFLLTGLALYMLG